MEYLCALCLGDSEDEKETKERVGGNEVNLFVYFTFFTFKGLDRLPAYI